MRCIASVFAALALALVAAQAAQAQTIVINRPNNGPVAPGEKTQHVSVNVQLSMPTPALTSTPDWTKAIATANQSLFEIINRECDVLGAALQGNCHLVQINTGSNTGNRPNPGGPFAGVTTTVNVNANATFDIEPKMSQSPAVVSPQR